MSPRSGLSINYSTAFGLQALECVGRFPNPGVVLYISVISTAWRSDCHGDETELGAKA